MNWGQYIQPALDLEGTHTLLDVEGMIARGEAQIWYGKKSAAITQIVTYPRFKSLHLWLCGGDMNEITDIMLPKAEAFARSEDCTRMTTGGRKGWDRVMSKHGFAPMASICAKELS